MNTVIIAEKPSQAKAYADAFTVKNRTKTYIELSPCPTFKSGAFLTWGVGHLVELKKPKETTAEVNTWDLNNLPFFPSVYEYKISDKRTEQYQSVKRLLNQAEMIINGCDVDREGSSIFYHILEHAGIRNKTIKRLWINSLEIEEVKKGFNNLRDNKLDYLMYQEARSRMVSDYLIGMNLTPLYTLRLKQMGGIDTTFSIGRVQTPTLYMIYQRHKEIEEFKPENFYEIHSTFKKGEQEYTGKMKLRDTNQSVVLDTLNPIQDETQATVKSINKQKKAQQAPKLHSLSTLQTVANKKWKYSPKHTLTVMQNLYEKKLVTYPRTDTQQITEQEFSYLKENLNQYLDIYNINPTVAYTEPRKRFVDGSKVQEHYAIILTKNVNQSHIQNLKDDEANIFKEVYNTTLAMFLEDYEYETTTVITNIKNCEFHSKGKIDVNLGWKALFNADPVDGGEEDNKLPELQEEDIVQASPFLHEGVTQPPKQYTEGQLINLMKTCGKLIDDIAEHDILKEVEGIGTEATRANIIDTLKKREYIHVSSNKVTITKKGQLLCQAVAGTLLSSPEMTAKWEKALKDIPEKQMDFDTFIANTEKYIRHQMSVIDDELDKNDVATYIKTVKHDIPNKDTQKSNQKSLGTCPKCQKNEVVKRKSKKGSVFYTCSDRNCEFIIFENMVGSKLSQTHVKELITNRQTKNKVKGFKSKKGNSFDAFVELNEEYKTQFKF